MGNFNKRVTVKKGNKVPGYINATENVAFVLNKQRRVKVTMTQNDADGKLEATFANINTTPDYRTSLRHELTGGCSVVVHPQTTTFTVTVANAIVTDERIQGEEFAENIEQILSAATANITEYVTTNRAELIKNVSALNE